MISPYGKFFLAMSLFSQLHPVFAHRIVVSSRFASSLRRSEEAEAVLNELLKTVSVPL